MGVGGQQAGERLAELVVSERYRRRWTQDQLASVAGVSRDTVSGIETGRARLGGEAVGSVLRSLDIAEGQLGEIYGDALRGTRYQHCLMVEPSLGVGLSRYIEFLGSLTEAGLLEEVVHDRRSSHRMAYLDALECRWATYEALATNQLPLQFRDDKAIEEAACSLVEDPADREAYVSLRRAYRSQRWRWLAEHPSRRRQQVVISAAGLTGELRALDSKLRAEQVIDRLSEAVLAHRATFGMMVVDTAGTGLPEVEVVSTRLLDLEDRSRVVGQGRRSVAIQHLRHGPGDPPTDYDLAVHFDPPFVERFFGVIRGFWFSALGQYRMLDANIGVDARGTGVAQVTAARLLDCLSLAYP
jgi:transcriptional regulator with XRE-family HTH domain